MSPKALPAELGLLVLDHIGSEGDKIGFLPERDTDYLATLHNCALVCKDWLPLARKYTFRTVYISNTVKLEAIEEVFQANPSLRPLVHTLNLTAGPMLPLSSILIFLRNESRVVRLFIRFLKIERLAQNVGPRLAAHGGECGALAADCLKRREAHCCSLGLGA